MRFRPCIDIHNGKVKQIVGGSLQDQGDQAQENYVAEQEAPFFARLYQSRGIRGGHIILLNPATSPYYEATRQQAIEALKAYPGGMQIGGGIREDNAESFLVTDRWQKFTQVPVSEQTIEEFSSHCDEFLVHAVDVEGKASGIEVELVKLLAKNHQLPVTYAGGVGSFQDLETLRMAGKNRVDVTVGSALDLFGGSMKWEDVLDICQKSENYFEK